MSANPVCCWELASHDAEKTIEFLRKVFDSNLVFDEKQGFYVLPADESDQQAFGGGGVFTLGKARLPFNEPSGVTFAMIQSSTNE